ncbi:hypothetical protein [Pseudooceanicola sp.]|uniref:hypothetical protein n=1 Tax=Pseudooceanicola sp. TaxID=1914328 RepID=UPI0035C69007
MIQHIEQPGKLSALLSPTRRIRSFRAERKRGFQLAEYGHRDWRARRRQMSRSVDLRQERSGVGSLQILICGAEV